MLKKSTLLLSNVLSRLASLISDAADTVSLDALRGLRVGRALDTQVVRACVLFPGRQKEGNVF